MKIEPKDRPILRALAARWMELAALPTMMRRRRQWTALKDLRPERPMVLFETSLLENYVDARELVCTDPDLRAAEHRLRLAVRHAEEVNDDLVLEPRFLLYWDIEQSDYGVPIALAHATDSQGGSLGYHFNHPLRAPEDVRRLKPRTRRVDRTKTLARQRLLGNLFGDILPVEIRGTGGLLASLTNAQQSADSAMVDVATGSDGDMHNAVLSVELESLQFDLAVQIRNRLVDAYQEMFRMSV